MSEPRDILHIHQLAEIQVGLYEEPFEKVIGLEGLHLSPVSNHPVLWRFNTPNHSMAGVLMDVTAYLEQSHIKFVSQGRLYLVKHKGQLLGLLMGAKEKRVAISSGKVKPVVKEQPGFLPDKWPKSLVERICRHRFRRVAVLNEKYLLGVMLRQLSQK